jgi:uncharacterized protein YdaT
MSKGKNQHVVKHDEGWAVKGAGNGRATAVTETKKQAVQIATGIAKNQQSELVVHGGDGKIQYKNTYGNDPYPPAG